MPVSEERLAQIRELSNDERVDGLDTSGFTEADWRRFGAELDAETVTFCRDNRDPEELHAFASTWNWDKGTWALQEIVDNPACEAATALLLYWRAGPEWYRQYADRRALAAGPLAASGLECFDFLTQIEARYVAGGFPLGSLAYDPADPADNMIGTYDHHRDKFVRDLPAVMYAAVWPKPEPMPALYSKEFFALYLTEVPFGREFDLEAEPAVVEMLAAPGYGLRLTIWLAMDSVSLDLLHPGLAQPCALGYCDHAHPMPHVLRFDEMEALCANAALEPPHTQAGAVIRLLLSLFTLCTPADADRHRIEVEAALTTLGFGAQEIQALHEQRSLAKCWGVFEGAAWDRRGDTWVVTGEVAYSFRNPDNDAVTFPYAEFADVMARFAVRR